MSIDLVAIFGDPTSPAVPSGPTSIAAIEPEPGPEAEQPVARPPDTAEALEAPPEAEAEREAIVWTDTAPAHEVEAALREAIDWFDANGDARQDLAAAAPRPRSAVPVAVEWPGAAADFVLLLAPSDLPSVPFALNGWTTITDAAKFLRSLRADILCGPGGPRARLGALQRDLLELQRFALQAHD